MAGTGPKPSMNRRRRAEPARGEWHATPGIGWQHGEIPKPPTRLIKASKETWATWFQAWFAAHWTPDDLPVLRQIIRLFDNIERGSTISAERTELRQLMDSYGITPKGQQDRRWVPPKPDELAPPEDTKTPSRYAGLRVVVNE